MTNDMHREAFDLWFYFLSYNNPHDLPDARDIEGNWRYAWNAAMRYRDELEKERQS